MKVHVLAILRGVSEKLIVASKNQSKTPLYFVAASKFPKAKVGDQIEIEEWFLELPRQAIYQLVLDAIA